VTKPVLSEQETEKLFKFWLAEGFKFRRRTSKEMQAEPKKYQERLRMEFGVIRSVPGYIDYFLMVSDLVRWAKDNGILVGPGRGSAAGSLCCWLLRITEIDPLLYPMLFERFLDPTRTDPPDIDIDFEDERRWEVIQYAQEKYGYDRVANILTFTRYKGKNSLDDVARVYEIPEWKIENIKGKLVERQDGHPRFSMTLLDTFDSYDDVAETVRRTPELQYAPRLEGINGQSNYRTAGIHPAGIVISGVPLTQITATYEKQSGAQRGSGVAYDKKDSEYLGLLKVDFLSLTTLTGIRATLEHLQWVRDRIGMTIEEFYQIPLDDPKVFEAFRAGDVLGIFQFEGVATRRVLKGVQPDKFMDLVDVNALSRPGGDDTAYIKAKSTGQLPEPVHPTVDDHIQWTWGTIVYQEQILLILRDFGGFAPAEVNRIRKIISAKEDSSVFNEFLERFVEGAASHGVSREKAVGVWQKMVNATGYAFNISHAVCYSDTAYRQMWLKVYYPEFYLGQLLKCPDTAEGLERRRKLIVEAERKGIKVNSLDLHESQVGWSLRGGSLYAGFTAVKGIGLKTAEKIVQWRDEHKTETLEWSSLTAVSGIGDGRVKVMRQFAEDDDPFGVLATKRLLDSIRREFEAGKFPGVPEPTHVSIDIVEEDEYVVFMGVLRKKTYKDTVQQRLKYGGDGLTREKILEELDEPHLLKYATLDVDDEYDEPIRLRVSRKKYPQYAGLIANARAGVDVILVTGYVTHFGGLAIQVKELIVINPEEDETQDDLSF